MEKNMVITSVLVSLLSLYSLGGCAQEGKEQMSAATRVGMANPFISCQSLEEAQKVAGFTFICPQELDGFGKLQFSAIKDRLIQLDFRNANEGRVLLRKAAATEDISGDYNQYPEDQQVQQGNRVVRLRGGQGKVLLATFSEGQNSYSIGFYGTSLGLSVPEMLKLVNQLK